MTGFRWHPAARALDAAGQVTGVPGAVGQGGALAADTPVAALMSAMGAAAFRIGLPELPAPLPGPTPMLETLSGGTTGAPKRIRRTQASWVASFTINAGLFGIGPGQGVAVLGDLIHSLALYASIEALHLGADLHLLAGLRPGAQRAALAARRVGVLYATPVQLRLLTEARGPDLPHLAQVVVGGSKLDPGLRAALAGMTGAQVTEFYGAAEASFITLSESTTPPESVGRPYPGVALRFDAGRVQVRSPYLAEGVAGPDGWHDTGEFGDLRAGHLILQGRAARMVKIADQAVFPEVIEAALLAQPGIRRAAVVPRPDLLRGAVLEAFVIGSPDQESALLAALRAEVGALACPRRVHWLTDWPELPSGKTDLAALARGVG